MSEQYIFRQILEREYTVIRNALIRDKNLTFEARGLLGYLLSQPPDWETSKQDLVNQSPAGEYAVGQILKELEAANYIFRRKSRTKEGKWRWETYVFDQPLSEEAMNELEKTSDEILGPEILARTKAIKEKNPSKVDKDKLSAAAAGIGQNDPLEGYPVHVKDLLGAFVSASEIKPTKSKKAFWIQTANEWREMGVMPQDIKPMYDYAVENYGGVAKPTGITSAFHQMRTARKDSKQMKGLRVAD